MKELKHDPGTGILVIEFREYMRIKHYNKKTIEMYFDQTVKFILWMEETLDKRVKEITQEDLMKYHLHLKQRNLSPNSIHRYIHNVKRFFNWLETAGYILINPTEELIIHRVPSKDPTVLTQAEIKKIINIPNTSTKIGLRDRAMLEVLYSTGIRLRELNNLNVFDIDTVNGFLRVNKGKFSRDRFAPLNRAACYCLNQYIKHARPHLVKNNPRETALFIGYTTHKKMNPVVIQQKIRAFGKQAGIKKRVTVHTFRHTFATHMLENGADIEKVKDLLGHKHLEVTQRYTNVTVKGMKETHAKHHPREKEKE